MGSVTLNRLFQATKEIEVAGRKLLVRAISDPEANQRHRTSILSRMSAEEKLDNPQSDEYRALIDGLKDAPRDYLVTVVTNYERGEIEAAVIQEVQPEYLPFPDNASADEEAAVLRRRKEQEETILNRRITAIERKTKALRDAVEALDDATLLKRAQVASRKSYLSVVYQETFLFYTLMVCVRCEDGKPYFKSMDEAGDLPQAVRVRLMGEVSEVNALDPLSLTS